MLPVALGMVVLQALAQGTPEPAQFPLTPGMFWIYSGNVAWSTPGTPSVQRRSITWRMEIGELVEREFAVAVVVTGYPRDLVFYEPDRSPRRWLIVRINGGRHYLIDPDRADAVLRRMKDPADLLIGLVRESEIFLVTPLALDQRFCETEALARADGRYCWWIDEERNPGAPIIGAPAGWDGLEYAMTYRSLSSTETTAFGRGVGMTSFDFVHHGTTSEVQLRLTEVGRRGPA
jgi:hypothetical protein